MPPPLRFDIWITLLCFREGGNTLGMEARHTDCQTWDLAEAELSDLRVKRKLFQPDPAAVGEAAASAATLDQPPSGQMSPDSQAASDGEPDALVGSWPGDLNPELRLSGEKSLKIRCTNFTTLQFFFSITMHYFHVSGSFCQKSQFLSVFYK